MLNFKDIQLEDKNIISTYLKQDEVVTTERNFTSLYMWAGHYQTQICIDEGVCYIRSKGSRSTTYSYYPPLGADDMKEAILKIADYEQKDELTFFGLSKENVELLSDIFSIDFTADENRENFDYLYNSESLATLAGRNFSGKRNHIHKFMKLYEGKFEYRKIDFAKDKELIMEFHKQWCITKSEHGLEDYKHESCAIMRALNHASQLDVVGGLLFVENKLVAYTLAAPTNETTIDILIEKADIAYNGSYTVINNLFANSIKDQYEFVNREEDMGIEGLRKAKLSYNPVALLEKYTANIKVPCKVCV